MWRVKDATQGCAGSSKKVKTKRLLDRRNHAHLQQWRRCPYMWTRIRKRATNANIGIVRFADNIHPVWHGQRSGGGSSSSNSSIGREAGCVLGWRAALPQSVRTYHKRVCWRFFRAGNNNTCKLTSGTRCRGICPPHEPYSHCPQTAARCLRTTAPSAARALGSSLGS